MDPDLKAAYEMFGMTIKKYSPKTIKEYLRVIQGVYEHVDILNAEKPTDIDAGIALAVRKKSWDPSYTWKMSNVVSAFCQWALADRRVERDPYPYSGFRKPKPKRPRFVTEADASLHLSNPFNTLQDIALMTVLWHTAIRREECSLIDHEDFLFNEKGGVLRIPPEKSKGGYGEREIPFGPEAAEIIKRQIECVKSQTSETALFLNASWKRMTDNQITDKIRAIGERVYPAKPEPVRLTPHMYRHGRGVIWLMNDVPHPVVMRWLGHASLEMLTHYINLATEYSQKMHQKYMAHEYQTA